MLVHTVGLAMQEWGALVGVLLFIVMVTIVSRAWRLPRRTGPGQPEMAVSVASPENEKILVVDDDPLIVEAVQRSIGSLGYQVVGVDSGEKAVEYMHQNGADLILLDLVLGSGMDGVRTYEEIRKIRPFQRVIVISGYATPEGVAAVRRLGVEHYLIKPVPPLMLAQAIRTELRRP